MSKIACYIVDARARRCTILPTGKRATCAFAPPYACHGAAAASEGPHEP